MTLAALPLGGTASQAKTTKHATAKHAKVKLPATPKSSGRLDAVIDISHNAIVSDFSAARRKSNILAVLHKASEGGDWADPMYGQRRRLADEAGLMWGAYHFGTRQYSGTVQAHNFLAAARPGPNTLMALDLEHNDLNPANTMRLRQAEDFVRAIFAATGRYPLIYTTARWADGRPADSGRCLEARVTDKSILVQCPLWLADYRSEPELPSAWRQKGWHLWQYAGDTEDGGPRARQVRRVWGIHRCDRNFFRGDAVALAQFWKSESHPSRRHKAVS